MIDSMIDPDEPQERYEPDPDAQRDDQLNRQAEEQERQERCQGRRCREGWWARP